jgi:nucleoid-associated protein YgaU
MAQETKVGLLVGMALILLVGLVLSELLTGSGDDEAADAPTDFGREAQAGIYPEPPTLTDDGRRGSLAGSPPRFDPEPSKRTAPDLGGPTETRGPGPAVPPNSNPPLNAEPPTTELDTQSADSGNAVARFDQSLQAMRLAIRDEPQPAVAEEPEMPARLRGSPEPEPVVGVSPTLPQDGQTMYIHYVQAGQTLAEIARQYYGNPEFARGIAEANPDRLANNGQPRAGVKLDIPPLDSPLFQRLFDPVHAAHAAAVEPDIPELPTRPAARSSRPKQVIVQAGDTLSGLAAEHLGSGGRWDELLQANRDQMTRPQDLRAGMTLVIPTEEASTAAAPAAPDRTASQNPTAASAKTYTVVAGDNLTQIARRLLGDGERWDELLEANADQLNRPEQLRVGMVLKLPDTPTAPTAAPATPAASVATRAADNSGTYTVKAGDNLTRIAAQTLGSGDRWDEIFAANRDRLASPDAVVVGQTLRLP